MTEQKTPEEKWNEALTVIGIPLCIALTYFIYIWITKPLIVDYYELGWGWQHTPTK